ncbi:MAG: SusD/RagB family nutrient-binding outer membrane lipoprotein [Saprospiraceae bacterium]
MKKINLILALFLGSTFFIGGCGFLNEDINIDPNNPKDVSMALLLPPTQSAYAFVAGGDFGRFTTIWAQQHAGVERQHAGYEVYQVKEGDVNNGWTTMYADVLNELSIIIRKSGEEDSPHYEGVAKVMTAASLGMLVDLFGDIPYSDALRGADGLKAGYDKSADVYTSIQTLLDEGIVALGAASSNFSPGSDDLMFGGDLGKWIAAARTLKARYYLHLSEIDGQAYTNALTAIDAGAIASNDGSAMVPFEDANQNPWFLFESDRGDAVMSSTLIDMMNNLSDPRLAVYATVNDAGVYAGSAPGVPDNSPAISRFGSLYGSAASSIPFVTYVESKFIEAEAALATDAARAATAYNEAVSASLDAAGTPDAVYITANASEIAATITLEKILTQKYIALYSQLEVYNDFRRKGIPSLSVAANTNATAIATRFPYPGDERRFNNDNMPQGVTVFDKVFWDAN